MKYHYVYMMFYEDFTRYIGVRSCKESPKEDTKYIGSSKYTPNDKILSKKILGVYETRKQAEEAEIWLHSYYCVSANPNFNNKAMANTKGFNTLGVSPANKGVPMSEKQRKMLSMKAKKRTKGSGNPMYGKKHKKETIEKIRKTNKKRDKIYGNAFKGQKHTEKAKNKMREKSKNKTNEHFKDKTILHLYNINTYESVIGSSYYLYLHSKKLINCNFKVVKRLKKEPNWISRKGWTRIN